MGLACPLLAAVGVRRSAAPKAVVLGAAGTGRDGPTARIVIFNDKRTLIKLCLK